MLSYLNGSYSESLHACLFLLFSVYARILDAHTFYLSFIFFYCIYTLINTLFLINPTQKNDIKAGYKDTYISKRDRVFIWSKMYKYNLLKPINSGKYGTVYIAQNKIAKTDHAIKILPKNRMDLSKSRNEFMIKNEIENMNTVKGHRNIVKLEEVVEDDEAFYLIEELCGGDTLAQTLYMNKTKQVSRTHNNPVLAAITDIINGIAHCHQNDIIFADLKPENIVFSRIDHCYKLTDFGSSIKVNPTTKEGVLITSTPSIAPPNDFTPIDPMVTFTFDVWSIGIIAKALYQANNIQNDSLLGFIHYCLEKEKQKRLSSDQMQSYWFEIISYEK